MLCDSSALIALLNRRDPDHVRCRQFSATLPAVTMVTTIACLTETMYFLGKLQGFQMQRLVWQMWEQDKLRVHCPGEKELRRMRELMELYSDVPMDFADASIVAAAEFLGISEIFTVDSHFYIYRLRDGSPLTVVP